jgi:Flp pilus assembly protein TadG
MRIAPSIAVRAVVADPPQSGNPGPPGRAFWLKRLLADRSGQSMIETALFLPILVLVMAYAVDYAYFFYVAADLTSASRGAVEYSIQGIQGPSQVALPAAGPIATVTSVAALAVADLNLKNASTTATIQVCTSSLGMNGNIPDCASYGPTGTAYTPATDPEAPTFVLQRVDITYTVLPPVPITFFKISLISSMQFHRQVSMRGMN